MDQEIPNNEKPCTSKNETSSPNKRAYLEVNNTEKYKQFLLKPMETKRLKPSEALSKVRDFLPMLKQSTEKLLEEFKDNMNELNIENVGEEEEHIEMNLAMVSDSGSDSEEDAEDSEDDDESGESSSESESTDELQLGFKVKNPNKFKKLKISNEPRPKKPVIELLSQEDEEKSTDDEQTQ